jgi:hypothetical protein
MSYRFVDSFRAAAAAGSGWNCSSILILLLLLLLLCSEYNICVFIFSTIHALKHFPFSEEFSEVLSQIYVILHINHPLLYSHFNQT